MKSLSIISALCIIMLATSCGAVGDNSPAIAAVNGRDIRRAEFEHFLALKMGEFNTSDMPDSLRSEMLDEYIIRQLVLDEAARAGVKLGDNELEQTIQTNPQMKTTASSSEAREELANDLIVEKYYRQVVLRDVRISTEEVQNYIAQNEARLVEKSGFYVREIRVRSREQAEALRREAVEGNKDFASLARQHSDAPNSEQGGLARYEEANLPDFLEKAIEPLKVGEISPVIQSTFGYHIFLLERRIQPRQEGERRPQIDERRAQLREELVSRRNQQAVDEAHQRLISSARIEIKDAALGFTYTGRLRHN
ncbi:MAG: peptidylprolyl isomerase [Acidobacteriota bacterium]